MPTNNNSVNFKGQVRIEDIKTEFDKLTKKINEMIDAYNNSLEIGNIDYNNASPKLGNIGFTLTIGGLKKVLEIYNGCFLGCKPFKVSDNEIKVTDGLYFKKGVGVIKIDGLNLIGPGDYLYYDTEANKLTLTKNENTTKVCDINRNRNSDAIHDNFNIQCEELPFSLYKIKTQSRMVGEFANEGLDVSKSPKFVCGMEHQAREGEGWLWTRLFQTEEVASNAHAGRRHLNIWTPINWLLIPKNCNNPYSYRGAAQKVFNVIINKEE